MVEQITDNGKEFDVPTWVDKNEMIAGSQSDSSSVFSHMTECKFSESRLNEFESRNTGAKVYDDLFFMSFTVPLNHCAEISHPVSMMSYPARPEFSFDADGAHFSSIFTEYMDFNSITVMSLPFDKKDHLVDSLIVESTEENEEEIMVMLEELPYVFDTFSDDYGADLKEYLEFTESVGGKYTINGDEWIAAAFVHSD